MSRVPLCAFSVLALGGAFVPAVFGQAVISTHSGLVHYFEGAVSVAGQPLEARPGKFAVIPEGAELRTEQGRAEVLLTPGVVLRVNEKSAIRLVADVLKDTRVELLAGSAIMDSTDPAPGTSVTLLYKDWSVRQPEKGAYRIDCQPPHVQVREGQVEVAATAGGAPVSVEKGMDLPLAAVLVPEKYAGETLDSFTDWSDGRAESISADNAIAANIQDPATMTGLSLPADGFTYFPMVGLSSVLSPYGSMGSYQPGLYGSMTPYQTGFYSIYLPGYTARPLMLHLPAAGLQRSLYPPSRLSLPSSPIYRNPGLRPVTPLAHPAVHIGVHR